MQFHSNNNYNCGFAKEIVFLESSLKEVSLEWYHHKILSTLFESCIMVNNLATTCSRSEKINYYFN